MRTYALNPVRAKLAGRAEDWCWSSVHALLDPARGDGITHTSPVLERVPDFAGFLKDGEDQAQSASLRRSESVGRPLGDEAFLTRVQTILGRDPKPGKPGPKPKDKLSALSP